MYIEISISYAFVYSRTTRLTESGIYQKWLDVAIFGTNHVTEKKSLITYGMARFGHFEGPIYVCMMIAAAAIIAFVFEQIAEAIRKKAPKRKKMDRRRHQHGRTDWIAVGCSEYTIRVQRFYLVN